MKKASIFVCPFLISLLIIEQIQLQQQRADTLLTNNNKHKKAVE